MRGDALCRAWRTPGVGAVSCSSTGPGGYRAPGFVSHSLVWLSMAFHTSLVKACWGAKEGTICRRRWHAGGDRMGCGTAAVIHLHAVRARSPPIPRSPCPRHGAAPGPGPGGNKGSSAHLLPYTVPRRPPPAGCGAGPRRGGAAAGKHPRRLEWRGPGCPWANTITGGPRGPAAVAPPLRPIATRSLAGAGVEDRGDPPTGP